MTQTPVFKAVAAAIVLLFGASACAPSPSSNSAGNNNGGANTAALAKSSEDATVTSKADGASIAITAYRPELAAGETAPLLIHGHGWALSRTTDFDPSNPINDFINQEISVQVAKRAWEAGYFVISFDQRGWGESEGTVSLMDPDLEGQDVSSLIDWAEANFGNHLAKEGDDPVVGSVGLSYGGGFQTIGSAVDDRFDAIVPIITWHDLRYSLFPNEVPKSIWAGVLVLAGTPTSQGSLPADIYQAFLTGATILEASDEFIDQLYNNSLVSFCEGREDGRGVPDVDALFVQGAHDVLFNVTEAALNHQCLLNAGNDSRLVVQRDGHIVPAVQQSGQLILFGMDETIHCGSQSFDTEMMMFNFLEEKLRHGPASNIPRVCFSQADGGQTLSAVPVGGISATVQSDNVLTGVAIETVLGLLLDLDPGALVGLISDLPNDLQGFVTTLIGGLTNAQENPEQVAAAIPALLNVLPSELLDELLTYQHFSPIHTATENQALAGLPTATINVDASLAPTPAEDPILFVGLAVQPADGTGRYLVNDQVIPVRGFGEHTVPMAGVNASLEPGDVVGFVVMPFHTQYATSFSRIPELVNVLGTAAAPVIDAQQQ